MLWALMGFNVKKKEDKIIYQSYLKLRNVSSALYSILHVLILMAGEFVYPPRISKQILVFRQKSSVNKPTLTPVLHDFVNIHVSPSEYVYLKCLFLTCGSI